MPAIEPDPVIPSEAGPVAPVISSPTMRMHQWLDRAFSLSARGTSLRTEALGGLATFATMAYVLAVNPMILAESGMDRAELITATALSAGIFSILLGLMSNLPLAQAPGMGANALFAYTIVLGLGVPWPAALGLVFWSGVIFLILTVSGVRKVLLDAMPANIRVALTVGIGLFIAFIGVKNSGLVIAAPPPMLLKLGDMSAAPVLMTLAGLVATLALMSRKVPGAIVLVILGMTFAGLFIPSGDPGATLTRMPEQIVAMPEPLTELWLALDLNYLWGHLPLALPALFTLVFLDLFSSLVAMNAMSQRAGLVDARGQMLSPGRALSADALATIGGSLLGTSTTNVYAESAAGIESGARTGLAPVFTGFLFFLALFLSPLLLVIPPQATAPALMLIGLLMFSEVRKLDFDDPLSSGAAVLTLFLMPITSITDGLAIGLMVYVGIMLVTGRARKVGPITWSLVAVFILYYLFAA